VNVATTVLQAFIVSRLVKYAGIAGVILALPIVALAAYSLAAAGDAFAVFRWAKTAENATDYSLQNTVRNVLFLPTTRQEKYSAKQAIDGFFVRGGDLLSAALVFAGSNWLALQTGQYALVNLVLVVGWLALAVLIGRRYERLAAATAS
jgi:AAA family ATP:ADP antiporter